MYTEFERHFLTEYYDYYRCKCPTLPSESERMFPNEEVIKDMKEKMFVLLKDLTEKNGQTRLKVENNEYDESENEYEEEIDEEFEDDCLKKDEEKKRIYAFYLNSYFISIIRDVLTYLIAINEVNKCDEKAQNTIKYILEHHIRAVINELRNGGEFTDTMISYYIRYLMAKHNFILSSEYEDEIFDRHDIITKIDINRGYSTINDKIRSMLDSIYDDYYCLNFEPEEDNDISEGLLITLDELIFSDIRDTYLVENGIDDRDKRYVNYIKNYMLRIILADAFLDLLMIKIDCEQTDGCLDDFFTSEEKEAYDFIEAVIESKKYALPQDLEVRHEIYRHYYFYNRELDLDRTTDLSKLTTQEETAKVLTLNPLIFLE